MPKVAGLASSKREHALHIYSSSTGSHSICAYARIFLSAINSQMLDIENSKNVTRSITKPTEVEIKASFSLSKSSYLNKWVLPALMSGSTSSHHMERSTQLWQSEPKRMKEEMKRGNRVHRKKKVPTVYLLDIK